MWAAIRRQSAMSPRSMVVVSNGRLRRSWRIRASNPAPILRIVTGAASKPLPPHARRTVVSDPCPYTQNGSMGSGVAWRSHLAHQVSDPGGSSAALTLPTAPFKSRLALAKRSLVDTSAGVARRVCSSR